MFAGLTLMAGIEGTFISSWLYLISFVILIYGVVGSAAATSLSVKYKAEGIVARSPFWLKVESRLLFAYLCLPAYYSMYLHEYEGLTINHVLILGGAAITTVNILKKNRASASHHEQ